MEGSRHVAIVGAGHAGGRVVQHLRDLGYDGRISLIGDEPVPPYERPALSKELLLGKLSASELTLDPAEFWKQDDKFDRIVANVTRVHSGARALTLDDGRELSFDTLVIASGGRPRRLPIPGANLPGVWVLRTIPDALAIRELLKSGASVVVIGAGVIGMEVAASAASIGASVEVLEAGDRVLARCLPEAASAWLRGLHERHGVTIRTGAKVQSIAPAAEIGTLQVAFERDDGVRDTLRADMVLMAVGIDCTPTFLEGSGVEYGNGVRVDSHCRVPGVPWVYAVGDVAEVADAATGAYVRQETWRNAENQARAVAEYIQAGRTEPYVEIPWMWTDQYGRNIQVVGMPCPGDEVVVRQELGDGPGCLVWFRNGCVAGGVLVDSGRERKALEALVARRAAPTRESVVSARRLKDLE